MHKTTDGGKARRAVVSRQYRAAFLRNTSNCDPTMYRHLSGYRHLQKRGPKAPARPRRSSNTVFSRVRVLWDYEATADDEMNIKAGTYWVVKTFKEDPNWWVGVSCPGHSGGTGIFPKIMPKLSRMSSAGSPTRPCEDQ